MLHTTSFVEYMLAQFLAVGGTRSVSVALAACSEFVLRLIPLEAHGFCSGGLSLSDVMKNLAAGLHDRDQYSSRDALGCIPAESCAQSNGTHVCVFVDELMICTEGLRPES